MDEATEAYNARPHAAVTVAPKDVETMPATFRVYQDNAAKFQHKFVSSKAHGFPVSFNARRFHKIEPQ